MKISIKVKPGSKVETVEGMPDGTYTVRVKARAKDGEANAAVVEAIAHHFGVPKTRVRIAHGGAGRSKVVEIV